MRTFAQAQFCGLAPELPVEDAVVDRFADVFRLNVGLTAGEKKESELLP